MPSPPATLPAELRELLRRGFAEEGRETRFVPSGIAPLDALLPGGGLPAGALIELLEEPGGCAAWPLAARLAAAAPAERGPVVWIDPASELHPPATFSLGLEPGRLLLVRPGAPRDALWAFDQAIRCPGVAAAVAPLAGLPLAVLRRLQLAAAAGGGLALLLRPGREGRAPSPASVRLRVRAEAPPGNAAGGPAEPRATPPARSEFSWSLLVEVAKARGGLGGGLARVEALPGAPADPRPLSSPPFDRPGLARPA